MILSDLPKDVELSEALKSQAEGYIEVMLYGKRYYVPVTKDLKKAFGLNRKKDQLLGSSNLENMLRDIICGVYLQIRETVGDEIKMQLSQEISAGFKKMFDAPMSDKVDKLLEDKAGEKQVQDQRI